MTSVASPRPPQVRASDAPSVMKQGSTHPTMIWFHGLRDAKAANTIGLAREARKYRERGPAAASELDVPGRGGLLGNDPRLSA